MYLYSIFIKIYITLKIASSIAWIVEFQVQTNLTDLQPSPCQELNNLSTRDVRLVIYSIFEPPFLTYWRLHLRLWDSKLLLLLECFCFFGFRNKVIYYGIITIKPLMPGLCKYIHGVMGFQQLQSRQEYKIKSQNTLLFQL